MAQPSLKAACQELAVALGVDEVEPLTEWCKLVIAKAVESGVKDKSTGLLLDRIRWCHREICVSAAESSAELTEFTNLWECKPVFVVHESFDEAYKLLKRKQVPDYGHRKLPRNNDSPEYAHTQKVVFGAQGDCVKDTNSHAGSSHMKKRIFPTNVTTGTNDGEVAHIVQADPKLASLYVDLTLAAFGLFRTKENLRKAQALIHGVSDVEGSRIAGTGLKHFVADRMRLKAQKYYDNDPCMMFIPILSLDRIRTWNGTGYQALVLVAAGPEGVPDIKTVCDGTGVTTSCGEEASVGEIEEGRIALVEMLHALGWSLKKMLEEKNGTLTPEWLNGVSPDVCEGATQNLDKLAQYHSSIKEVQVPTPTRIAAGITGPVHVRKVSFKAHTDPEGCPAPDPLLLLARSAITYSHRHGSPLMAMAEPIEEESDVDDDAALELWNDWFISMVRARSHDSLISLVKPVLESRSIFS